jgi:phosphocarrier protein HPr
MSPDTVPGLGPADGVGSFDRVVAIVNRSGMHARAVWQFVEVTKKYQAAITVQKGDAVADGRDSLELLLLEAPKGTRLHLRATGADAEQLIEEVTELINGSFYEE